eukprot:TRINITY_DN1317_c2_g1_i1.p1 TRINITY_DN1317_c2_g1~~TRINITY_DN1317_c2_g1_i1.p1  ORF type:complete len:177 (+),score=25.73 TRINITY_DN1317_c2_g1_i1:61-531(+)
MGNCSGHHVNATRPSNKNSQTGKPMQPVCASSEKGTSTGGVTIDKMSFVFRTGSTASDEVLTDYDNLPDRCSPIELTPPPAPKPPMASRPQPSPPLPPPPTRATSVPRRGSSIPAELAAQIDKMNLKSPLVIQSQKANGTPETKPWSTIDSSMSLL